jgi:hypothetical protein
MATYEDQLNALTVLVNGVRVAQRKGIYTLEEAEVLSVAVRSFSQNQQQTHSQTTTQPAHSPPALEKSAVQISEPVKSDSTTASKKRGRPSKK